MKTQVLASSCLAAGLCIYLATGPASRSGDTPAAPGPGRRDCGNAKTARSARGATEEVCRLAREGKVGEAWKLAMALPGPQRDECLPLLAAIQAGSDPLGTWRETLAIPESDLRQTCQLAVLRGGSDGCLPDLAAMAATLPDAAVREAMLREIVSRWALQDPAALSAWPDLASLPASVRDEAARRLVIHGDRLNRSPEVAGAWAETIEEPELRSAAMEAAAREWFAEDSAAATEFVRHSQRLDDDRRKSILSALGRQAPP